ncbi:MAG: universal stress protein [Caldilineaceae bacterium]|nr:universal stress protein [Caldilineaceae bacterium]
MTTTNQAVLACVDGSVYTDSICAHAAWAAQRLDAPVRLLHVQAPGSDHAAPTDFSGAIGLGAKSSLLEKLAQMDEARGRLDQQKGKVILEHARELLAAAGVSGVEALHRRGSLVETITELEGNIQLSVLGKRGEQADFASLHLGSNLERVARAAHRPLLVAARAFKSIDRFVIAYDGGPSTVKAVAYVAGSPLFRGLECHVLAVGNANDQNRRRLEEATTKLRNSGLTVKASLQPGQADEVIADYVSANGMDMLIMGAYGHSHIRTLIIGSTTSSMLRSCLVPVLMFR